MIKQKKTVLLYSGGMDSFICNWLYRPDILLYIKTGCRYEEKELKYINKFILDFELDRKFEIIDMSFLRGFELSNAHIPLRNLLFIQVASLFGDEVYLCALRGETSKDKSKKFRRMTQRIINYCMEDELGLEMNKKIKVTFPFKDLTKTKVLKKYLDTADTIHSFLSRNVLIDFLKKYTVSCYSDLDDSCGWCMSCYRRWVAEVNNGIYTTRYAKSPYNYYLNELKSQFKGIWTKYKLLYKKEFYVNIPSNIGAYKANKKFKKLQEEIKNV